MGVTTPVWQLKSYEVEYYPVDEEATTITRVITVQLSNGITEKTVVDGMTHTVADWPATAVPDLAIGNVVAAANA